jgi:mRNA-degrading endonuclease toxin of MazEF toxin-antitoxin module
LTIGEHIHKSAEILASKSSDDEEEECLDSRPVLIISEYANVLQDLQNVIALKITKSPNRYGIPVDLKYPSKIMPYNVFTLDVRKLGNFQGILDKDIFDKVFDAFLWHIGKSENPPEYIKQYTNDFANFKTHEIIPMPKVIVSNDITIGKPMSHVIQSNSSFTPDSMPFKQLLSYLHTSTQQRYLALAEPVRLHLANLNESSQKDINFAMTHFNVSTYLAPKFIRIARAEKQMKADEFAKSKLDEKISG